MNLENQLDEFVEKWKGLVQQSQEWKLDYGCRVGGSELAVLLGKDKYKTLEQLIAQKVAIRMGTHTFEGSLPTHWGNLFEDVIARYFELNFDTKIKGDSICVRSYDSFRYSPDGMCLISLFDPTINYDWNLKRNNKIIYTTDMEDHLPVTHESLTLLEFKCPYNRIPNKIPEHYEIQVLAGLDVIPLVEFAMFTDALFRRCSLSQIGKNTFYNHLSDFRGPAIKQDPIAYGVIGFFGPLKISTVDIGDICSEFPEILDAYAKRIVKVERADPWFYDGRGNTMLITDVIENWQKRPDFVCFMCWKLFDVKYTIVERVENYVTSLLPKINDVIAEVNRRCEILTSKKIIKLNDQNLRSVLNT